MTPIFSTDNTIPFELIVVSPDECCEAADFRFYRPNISNQLANACCTDTEEEKELEWDTRTKTCQYQVTTVTTFFTAADSSTILYTSDDVFTTELAHPDKCCEEGGLEPDDMSEYLEACCKETFEVAIEDTFKWNPDTKTCSAEREEVCEYYLPSDTEKDEQVHVEINSSTND